MITRAELDAMRNASIDLCNASELVDIQRIKVNKTQTVQNRVQSYISAVGNPYLFKVDDLIVKINFNPNGKSFNQAIEDMLQAV